MTAITLPCKGYHACPDCGVSVSDRSVRCNACFTIRWNSNDSLSNPCIQCGEPGILFHPTDKGLFCSEKCLTAYSNGVVPFDIKEFRPGRKCILQATGEPTAHSDLWRKDWLNQALTIDIVCGTHFYVKEIGQRPDGNRCYCGFCYLQEGIFKLTWLDQTQTSNGLYCSCSGHAKKCDTGMAASKVYYVCCTCKKEKV